MDDFDQFWSAYPRRQAKGDARKAWIQTQRIRPELQTILDAIIAASRSEQWMKDGGQFIPLPASWLRAERWDDEHVISLKPKLPLGVPKQEAPKQMTEAEKEAAQRAREQLKDFRLRVAG